MTLLAAILRWLFRYRRPIPILRVDSDEGLRKFYNGDIQ